MRFRKKGPLPSEGEFVGRGKVQSALNSPKGYCSGREAGHRVGERNDSGQRRQHNRNYLRDSLGPCPARSETHLRPYSKRKVLPVKDEGIRGCSIRFSRLKLKKKFHSGRENRV